MGRRFYQRPNVHKTGGKNPQWYFRVRVGGKDEKNRPEEKFYLGECREITKRQAEKIRDEVIEQEKINEPTVRLLAQVKFSEVLTAYRKTFMPGLRPTTARNYGSAIDKHIEPRFGSMRMCDIHFRSVQEWAYGIDLCVSSKKFVVAVFNAVWKAAVRMGFTREIPPSDGIKIIGAPSSRKRLALTWDEWRKVRAALPSEYHLLADTVMFTGVRISEALGMKWDRINGRGITIDQRIDQVGIIGDTKSHAGRRILPLGPLAPAVAAHRRTSTSDFLFHGVSYEQAQAALKAAALSVGIQFDGFGWHSLRRTYNTWLRDKASASVAKAQLGHANTYTNDIYVVASSESFEQQEAAMNRAYAEAMGDGGVKVQ